VNTQTLNQLKAQYRTPETPGSFFLSLEGIEGSGKSTQIKEVQNFAESKGYRVLSLREPGGTVFGEKLREAILQSASPLHPLAECHLFLASRAQLLKEKILPFLFISIYKGNTIFRYAFGRDKHLFTRGVIIKIYFRLTVFIRCHVRIPV
jgi:hypothetical protein